MKTEVMYAYWVYIKAFSRTRDFLHAWVFVEYMYLCYHISVEPEDLKKLGSALNALSNEKSKQQKVGETREKQSWLVNQLISSLHILDWNTEVKMPIEFFLFWKIILFN